MIAFLFKPKWQHAKAEKRIKAIAKMRLSNEKNISILSRLAVTDEDERVRVAATEKITNLNLLIKISQTDPSQVTREQALHNISKVLLSTEGPKLEQKLKVLTALMETNFLAHIVLNSHEKALREQAIEQLDDNRSLLTIAEKSQRASIRVLAAQKLTCVQAIETLHKSARNKDNGVYKITKEKLHNIKEQAKLEEQRQQQLTQLIDNLTQHSQGAYFALLPATLSALKSQWQELSSSACAEQQSQFHAALELCLKTISDHEQAEKAANQAAQAKAQAIKNKDILLAELTDLKSTFQNRLPEQNQIQQLSTILDSLNTSWKQLKAHATKAECILFDKAKAQLDNLRCCFQAYLEQLPHILSLIECLQENNEQTQQRPYLESARQTLNNLSWPRAQAKPSELLALEETITEAEKNIKQQAQHSQQLQSDLKILFEELESSIQKGKIRTADKQIKRAEQLSKRIQGSLSPALHCKMSSLAASLKEIKDWQAYAITPKKEALCFEMETLVDADIPIQEKANKIRKIQKGWKALDATDSNHSQKLWRRFKQASDQAYAPCDDFFSEQKALREKNLQLRQQLCQQLEIHYSDIAEISDWKAYDAEIKSLKQKWRSLAPIDRSPGKQLQQRFDQLLEQLETPLKHYQQANLEIKEGLIQQAESILKSDISLHSTEQIKDLQKCWKAAGQAPRDHEKHLWEQFREICNQVFAAFYANKPKLAGASSEFINALFTDMESNIDAVPRISFLEPRATQAEKLLDQLGSKQMLVAPFHQRLERINQFITTQKSRLNTYQEEPYLQLIRKSSLCEQLEQALLDDDSEQIDSVIGLWQEQVHIPSALNDEINKRYATLLHIKEAPQELEATLCAQETHLRVLCIRLEIETSAATPVQDQALRMEYQMTRLQQDSVCREKNFDLGRIKHLEFEWMCIPFAKHFEELYERFESQIREAF